MYSVIRFEVEMEVKVHKKIIYALLLSLLFSVFHDISLYAIDSCDAQRIDTYCAKKQTTSHTLKKEYTIEQIHSLFHTAALLPQPIVSVGTVPICQLDFQIIPSCLSTFQKVIVKPPIHFL